MTTSSTASATITTDPMLIDTTTIAGQFVGVHVLRPVVAVNLNANQDGTPKTLILGDATRLRVSSQARKRAMRDWTHQYIAHTEQAMRTRQIPRAAARILAERRDIDASDALNAVDALILGVGKFSITPLTADRTEELAFVPNTTPAQLADIADTHWDDLRVAIDQVANERAVALANAAAATDGTAKGRGRTKKADKAYLSATTLPLAIKKKIAAAYAPGASSEIALNGRMLTGLPDGGAVEAAASVAHSYSVNPVIWTTDEWTAADDWQDGDFDSTGSAMLDTRTLASGTLYEWCALDRARLRANLAESSTLAGDALDNAARTAEQMWVSSAAWAVPSASSHSTGSNAAPTLVAAVVADTPPLTPPIYETAITDDVSPTAAKRLADYLTRTNMRRPITGGVALWMPALSTPAPAFPAAMTIEEA